MAKEEEFLRENDGNENGAVKGLQVSRSDFPPDFIFGVATSAYQIEGASNEGGRGPSIWDAFSHTEGKILDKSNGDVAVDHYHRYMEDIDLIAKLGFGAYRFSISWSRIFPDGLGTKVNDEGITFYNNIINALLEKGIKPFVTLYHWDLPLHLDESMGGWLNKKIVDYFAIYADTCFANFGDRVKNWITINEPLQTSVNGYITGIFAPGRSEKALVEPYLAAHHQILAHAAAVSVYRSKYKDIQGGQVGLVVDCEWSEAN
ncbi:Beta-glucosidase 42, partial [Stylosanthes scabra]|nr:Beta-glucosidase 42 [Stylosanthes scabra]